MAYYGTTSSQVIAGVGGLPKRFNLAVSSGQGYQIGRMQVNTGYQQQMDARYGGNSDLVSYFDRQRDVINTGYDQNYRTFNSSQFNSGEMFDNNSSIWRFGQKLNEDGGLNEFKFPNAGAPNLGTINSRAISMPSSGETIDKAIEAVGLKRLGSGAFANQQDQYAFEDLTALKSSGNVYAPSTQFVIKKQTNANNAMAADIKSQGERSTLEAKIRSKASQETSKRKTSFRNTTINMGSNGLKIPNGTGS